MLAPKKIPRLPPTQYFVSFVCFHPSHSWDVVPIVSVMVPKQCHLVLVGRWLSAKKIEDSPLPIQSVGDDLRDPNKNPQQKFIVCLHPQYIFPISSTQKNKTIFSQSYSQSIRFNPLSDGSISPFSHDIPNRSPIDSEYRLPPARLGNRTPAVGPAKNWPWDIPGMFSG